MTIVFRNEGRKYIKEWVNWTGVIPQIGDHVALHFGDYNEEEYIYVVTDRLISGTAHDKVFLTIGLVDTINTKTGNSW